ncbi:hypothetical protein FO519_004989 [Halicephalobus sp. NKZ332]|nr:hypothetical protein FO519_004989 [Halicephalobus sp. NKZ332]
MSQLSTTISMTIHAVISILAILINSYIIYPRSSSLFRKKKEYFLILVITVINLTKCILPADVSIGFLISLFRDPSPSPLGPPPTRLQCITDFRAATLTTVYFFHGFVMAWIAVERFLTIRNPLKVPTSPLLHGAILLGFGLLSSGIYLACYIDAVAHDPEKGSEACAMVGTLGPRLLYPIMGLRILSIIITLGIYPFLMFGLINLRKKHSQQKFKAGIQKITYKISVTMSISLVLDLTVEFGPDIITFFGLVPFEYYTFVQNIYLSRSLIEPIIFSMRLIFF